jgi:hypothetical protein
MSVYTELMRRIVRGYQDAGNGFHPEDAQAKIRSALAAFDAPFDDLDGAIQKQRAGLYPNTESYKTASTNALRVIDADLDVLKTAVANAARADNAKIARVIVDQSVAVRKAKAQQQADREMVAQVEKLIGQARTDAKVAGELSPPGGGALDRLSKVDVTALEAAIAQRASPKEDAIAAEQLAEIGGQDSED